MRHLRSILYALALAPAVWILCGVGFTQDLTGRARDAGSVETASAILLLVLAGAAYAILVFSPISPLGPALFGLLFLGVSLWAVIAPDSYASVWPAGITKEGFDLSRPGYALAALLAIPMLCTALSMRRWHGYEPPQLPLIGTLGRVRGAAVAPGTPVAAERTTVITTADPTEVITLPTPAPPPPGQIAPTPVAGTPWPAQRPAEPPTEAVPTQPVPVAGADEPTAMMEPAPASSDEPTTTVLNDDQPGDEPTVMVTSTPSAAAGEDDAGEDDAEQPADEPTVASVEEPADPAPAVALDEPDEDAPAAEEPAGVEPAGVEPAGVEPAGMEPAGVEPEGIKDEVAAEDAAAEGTEEIAGTLPATRIDPDADEPTRPLGNGDRAQGAGPGETTQVIFWREPADQTTPEEAARAQAAIDQAARDRAAQERARQAFRDRAAQERAKTAFAERAAQDAREHGEQTQVINLAETPGQPVPGDQTQVLPGTGQTEPASDRTQKRPDAGTVEPPGDRTQVLSLPTLLPAAARQNPGERTTDKQEPATRANSIIGAEQPDPGADPTTRLSPLRPVGTDSGEDTTANVGDNRRTKGVLDLERPADETADDARGSVVPPPRQPPDDEPTTRL